MGLKGRLSNFGMCVVKLSVVVQQQYARLFCVFQAYLAEWETRVQSASRDTPRLLVFGSAGGIAQDRNLSLIHI